MKRILMVCTMIVTIFLMPSNDVNAAQMNEIEYDLSKTGLVSYETIDENGEEVIIEIEKIPSLKRVAQGTYKINKTLKGKWTISFKVKINTKDQITGTSELSTSALSGSFTATSLTNDKTSATCSFTQKIGTVSSKGKVVAKISKGKLTVE